MKSQSLSKDIEKKKSSMQFEIILDCNTQNLIFRESLSCYVMFTYYESSHYVTPLYTGVYKFLDWIFYFIHIKLVHIIKMLLLGTAPPLYHYCVILAIRSTPRWKALCHLEKRSRDVLQAITCCLIHEKVILSFMHGKEPNHSLWKPFHTFLKGN